MDLSYRRSSSETRGDAESVNFRNDLREMLAISERRRRGYAARPELSLQMELSNSFVIARAYTLMLEATARTRAARLAG